jgi:hypothetical protein
VHRRLDARLQRRVQPIGAKRTLLAGLDLIIVFGGTAGASNSIGAIVGLRAGWGLGNALFIAPELSVTIGSAGGRRVRREQAVIRDTIAATSPPVLVDADDAASACRPAQTAAGAAVMAAYAERRGVGYPRGARSPPPSGGSVARAAPPVGRLYSGRSSAIEASRPPR